MDDNKGCHNEALRKINRLLKKHDLRWIKLFEHLNIPAVTEEEVDEALAREGP